MPATYKLLAKTISSLSKSSKSQRAWSLLFVYLNSFACFIVGLNAMKINRFSNEWNRWTELWLGLGLIPNPQRQPREFQVWDVANICLVSFVISFTHAYAYAPPYLSFFTISIGFPSGRVMRWIIVVPRDVLIKEQNIAAPKNDTVSNFSPRISSSTNAN